jgi:chromosome segregation ATPase
MATIRYSEPAEVEASIKAVEDHIRQVLTILYETRRKSQDESLERTTKQADRARATVDMLTQEMQQLRNRAITLGVIPGSLDAQLAGLQKSQLDIRVELAGLSARREAIVNRVAEMQKQQAEKQAGSQQVLDELTKVVELHMEQFARIRELQKTGTAPTSEVGRVQIELAKARADLESRRHQFAQEAETEALSLLNQQLADTQIEDQGKRAELMVIEETLAKLQSDEVRNTVDVYDRAVRQLESAVDEERMAAKQLSELKMQHDAMHEPSVLFIPQGLPEEKPQEK